jgi:gliding motility-associated-like protein
VWEINGNQLAGSSLTITPQQATTALFIATDLESCNIADTVAVFISVVTPPAATFEFEQIDFPCEQRAEVVVGFTGSATTLLWDFGDGLTSSFADENHVYLTGDYQLTLTAFAPPCAPAESAIDIEVAPYSTGSGDIFPVNIITPNGDGINDCLYWDSMQYDNISDFSISIFNRWGVLVYSSTDGAFRWCPTDVEAGVYYYFMKWYDACEESEGVVSGEVTVTN